jgi:hypothetical protein
MSRIISILCTLLWTTACVEEPVVRDLWVDAGPDFAGYNLDTHLHSSVDGHVVASLTARRFSGFQSGDSQVLEGVQVHFLESGFRLDALRARMISVEDVELNGKVHGRLNDGRGFRAPSVVYSGRTRTLKIDGPVEFYGEGHSLEALGGASTDDRFESLKLMGPVSGSARIRE